MDINALYQDLLKPSDRLLSDIAELDGDILILGVGGKMGPSLARLAKQAVDAAGTKADVLGVARFSVPGLEHGRKESKRFRQICSMTINFSNCHKLLTYFIWRARNLAPRGKSRSRGP
jgi:hypothetical protein